MSIASMTGFARNTGTFETTSWQWDARSVNGKALDVRLRLPAGYEHLETAVRTMLGKYVKRGNLQVSLTVSEEQAEQSVKINEVVLEAVVAAAKDLRKRLKAPPIQVEALLGLRGVLDVAHPELSTRQTEQRDQKILASLEKTAKELNEARASEGKRLGEILQANLTRIKALADAARNNPARQPAAIKANLKILVDQLMEANSSFDSARLHQEAVLAATRSDIQEELDRLESHIAAASELLRSPEPIGRKFDFLAQEFNREANTLCSKAVSVSLTNIGLDLKTTIDQLREQVQNIE